MSHVLRGYDRCCDRAAGWTVRIPNETGTEADVGSRTRSNSMVGSVRRVFA